MATRSAPEARFWAKVNKDGPAPTHRSDLGSCWLWTASTNWGYGVLSIDGRSIRAHRFAYELLVGPIPEGLQLDHLCHVRHCVRPDHLEPVTLQENVVREASYINSLKPPRRPVPSVPRTPSPYGNPYRDPRTGRFTSAVTLAALRRVNRLTSLGGDLDALQPFDTEIAALAYLHAAVNTAIALRRIYAAPDQTGEVA